MIAGTLLIGCSRIASAPIAVNGVGAYGEQVFFAREFLYTNEFRMGFDLFPEGPRWR
jgi:hypothetical protein